MNNSDAKGFDITMPQNPQRLERLVNYPDLQY